MAAPVGVLVLCILAAHLLCSSLACNGYHIKVNHIRNCNPNSLIKMERFNITLDNNCNLIPSGCIVIAKGFQTAEAHYVLNKPPIPTIEGDMDLCDALATITDSTIAEAIVTFQLPNKCPVKPGRSCTDSTKRLNISKQKNRLAVGAGTLSIKTDITHDSGVSCMDINLTLEKVQRG